MVGQSIFQNPKSGSIKVTGAFEVVDETENKLSESTDPKLCGCGLSQDKPYCDKSHANYVTLVVQMLEMARQTRRAVIPVGTWKLRAHEIRKRQLENRVANGETLKGIKLGGALLKSADSEKHYQPIIGFLTDAMEVKNKIKIVDHIAPVVEAEIVFKLGRELSSEISLTEASGYISEIAPGIEIFDCRYGAIDPFIDDAIADNACAGAYVIGNWVKNDNFEFLPVEIAISVDGKEQERVPATNVAGNPWQAVVNASIKLAETGVTLPAGSIIFSGSATQGIAMQTGKYCVEITGLGEVTLEAIN